MASIFVRIENKIVTMKLAGPSEGSWESESKTDKNLGFILISLVESLLQESGIRISEIEKFHISCDTGDQSSAAYVADAFRSALDTPAIFNGVPLK